MSLKLLLSITPMLFVMIGIVVLKFPAKYVSPLALIYTIAISLFAFDTTTIEMFNQTKGGVIGGAKLVYMIWTAFLILNMLISTGAMDKIKEVITELTDDRRKQVIIVAFCFGAFLEGVAGAGTPAAIAAPFLVALGINPISATVAALICNGVPSSWGAAGLSTVGGFAAYSDKMSILSISGATGRIHMIGALVVPFIVIFVLYGKKGFKGLVGYLLSVGIVAAATLFFVSNFVGPEFTSITWGLAALVAALAHIKIDKSKTPEEFRYVIDKNKPKSKMSPLKALSTYIILLITLPLVRFFGPKWFIDLGFAVWIGTVILVVCIVGSIILNSTKEFPQYMKVSFFSVVGALIAMCALMALANVMKSTGMLSIIAKALSDIAGRAYPAIAVLIGSLGSFMTGTTLGSNIMFSPMHLEACTILGINPFTVFGAQSAGGALGNMICPNNVVAVCATVGLINSEGLVMRKVIKPIIVLWIIYGTMALLNTYVLFPTFGVYL